MPDPHQPTVLVTGSSGLIGTAVCNRFGGRFNVVGFDRAGPPHPRRAVAARCHHCRGALERYARRRCHHRPELPSRPGV